MRKKLVSKKKTVTRVSKLTKRTRSHGVSPARSHHPRAQIHRWKTYYAMGAVALASGVFVLGYVALKGKDVENENYRFSSKFEAIQDLKGQQVLPTSLLKNSNESGIKNSKQRVSREVDKDSDGNTLAPEFVDLKGSSLQEKINFWSNYIETEPTGRKKIAELVSGYQIDDTAPLVPSRYNCTTYVETVVALARSDTPDQFVRNLLSIRYEGGQAGYERRNHFPEADWIPNNERASILEDITNRVALSAGLVASVEKKVIDRAKWYAKQKNNRAIASLDTTWLKPVEVNVSYIDLDQVKKALKKIPNGAVLNLVHQNDDHHPVLITHQGFVIRDGDQLFLRHASTNGRIRTSPLLPYLNRLHAKGKKDSWPLLGVNLLQINDSVSASSFLKDSM